MTPVVQARLTYAGSYHASVSFSVAHPKAENAPSWHSGAFAVPDNGNPDNRSWAGRKKRSDSSAEADVSPADSRRLRCLSDQVTGNGIREIVRSNPGPLPVVARSDWNTWVEQPETLGTAHPGGGDIAALR